MRCVGFGLKLNSPDFSWKGLKANDTWHDMAFCTNGISLDMLPPKCFTNDQ